MTVSDITTVTVTVMPDAAEYGAHQPGDPDARGKARRNGRAFRRQRDPGHRSSWYVSGMKR
jgi:hypothetical protein